MNLFFWIFALFCLAVSAKAEETEVDICSLPLAKEFIIKQQRMCQMIKTEVHFTYYINVVKNALTESIFALLCLAASAKAKALEVDICVLPLAGTDTCQAAFPRFYYNNEAKECQEFTYGGCDGNENHFETMEECEKRCKKN